MYHIGYSESLQSGLDLTASNICPSAIFVGLSFIAAPWHLQELPEVGTKYFLDFFRVMSFL